MNGEIHVVPGRGEFQTRGNEIIGTLENTVEQLSSLDIGKYLVKGGSVFEPRPILGIFGIYQPISPERARGLMQELAKPTKKKLHDIKESWETLDSSVKKSLVELTKERSALESHLVAAYEKEHEVTISIEELQAQRANFPEAVDVSNPEYARTMMDHYFEKRNQNTRSKLVDANKQAKSASRGLTQLMLTRLDSHNSWYDSLLHYSTVVEVFHQEASFLVASANLELLQITRFWELAYDSAQACRGREDLGGILDVLDGVISNNSSEELLPPTAYVGEYAMGGNVHTQK